jgi:hypothetical protein
VRHRENHTGVGGASMEGRGGKGPAEAKL